MRSLEPSNSWKQKSEVGCQGRDGAGWGSSLGRGQVLDVAVGWLHVVNVSNAAELYPENGKSHAIHVLPQCNKISQERKESRERTLEKGCCTVQWKGFHWVYTKQNDKHCDLPGLVLPLRGPSSLASHIWLCLPQTQSLVIMC